eukprot:Opistho-2@78831
MAKSFSAAHLWVCVVVALGCASCANSQVHLAFDVSTAVPNFFTLYADVLSGSGTAAASAQTMLMYNTPSNSSLLATITVRILDASNNLVTTGPNSQLKITATSVLYNNSLTDNWKGRLCTMPGLSISSDQQLPFYFITCVIDSAHPKGSVSVNATAGIASFSFLTLTAPTIDLTLGNDALLSARSLRFEVEGSAVPVLLSQPHHATFPAAFYRLTADTTMPTTIVANTAFPTMKVEAMFANPLYQNPSFPSAVQYLPLTFGIDANVNVDLTIPRVLDGKTLKPFETYAGLLISSLVKMGGAGLTVSSKKEEMFRVRMSNGVATFNNVRVLDVYTNLRFNLTATKPHPFYYRVPLDYSDAGVLLTPAFNVTAQQVTQLVLDPATDTDMSPKMDAFFSFDTPPVIRLLDASGMQVFSGPDSTLELTVTVSSNLCLTSQKIKAVRGAAVFKDSVCQDATGAVLTFTTTSTFGGSTMNVATKPFNVGREIRIGFLIPRTGAWGWVGGSFETASILAFDNIKKGKYPALLPGFQDKLIPLVRDSASDALIGVSESLTLIRNARVKLIIGPGEEPVPPPVSQVCTVKEIGQLSYTAPSEVLSDKTVFPYFSRIGRSVGIEGIAMAKFLANRGWTQIALITSVSFPISKGFLETSRLVGINILTEISVPTEGFPDLTESLTKVKESGARIILNTIENEASWHLYKEAMRMGVAGQDGYQWVAGSTVAGTFPFANQFHTCSTPPICTAGMRGYVFLLNKYGDPTNDADGAWASLLTDYLALDPVTHNGEIHMPTSAVLPFLGLCYDTVMVFATALNQFIINNRTITGPDFATEVRKVVYQGVTGTIRFDANGDRIGFEGYVLNLHANNTANRPTDSSTTFAIPSVVLMPDKDQPLVEVPVDPRGFRYPDGVPMDRRIFLGVNLAAGPSTTFLSDRVPLSHVCGQTCTRVNTTLSKPWIPGNCPVYMASKELPGIIPSALNAQVAAEFPAGLSAMVTAQVTALLTAKLGASDAPTIAACGAAGQTASSAGCQGLLIPQTAVGNSTRCLALIQANMANLCGASPAPACVPTAGCQALVAPTLPVVAACGVNLVTGSASTLGAAACYSKLAPRHRMISACGTDGTKAISIACIALADELKYCAEVALANTYANGLCTSNNLCRCNAKPASATTPGWIGADCSIPQCAQTCVKGTCTGPDTCTCAPYWTGTACEIAICQNTCTAGHGRCDEDPNIVGTNGTGVYPNKCFCAAGFYHGALKTCENTCQCDPKGTLATSLLANGTYACGESDGACLCKSGYSGQSCHTKAVPIVVVAAPAAAGGALILILIILFARWYLRRQKEAAELANVDWMINYEQIQLTGKMAAFGSRMGSMTGSRAGSRAGSRIGSRLSQRSGGSGGSEGRNQQTFCTVGVYTGLRVAIRMINKPVVDLNNNVRRELRVMRDLRHTNVVNFIGVCVTPPNVCIVTEYAGKGSLADVLSNADLPLDWAFKYSLARDIANGMEFLHKSEIKSHGRLKSSNCLIDQRWVLKLTDFGLHEFKAGQVVEDESEYKTYAKLLWTAPEILRNPPLQNFNGKKAVEAWQSTLDYGVGTPAGDIYSYGIVMWELLTREPPYSNSEDEPKGIIEKVKAGNHRPDVPEDCPEKFLAFMKKCWAEVPEERHSTFGEIIRQIKKIHPQSGNLVDNMIRMLEQYSSNLESLVEERTAELGVEKERAEELLYRMIPRKVAEDLKLGKPVKAETFEEVTIYFSDIVGFTAIAGRSTPIQVVDLLNALYTTFDAIIDHHDVYKVETIGDAYMVVSGLPIRNGKRHAPEMANMSLDLLASINGFQIPHLPGEQLKLRIGLHSGTAVAGVVGLKMPRYCLFGDTVGTASKMESGGAPLRIHISECTNKVLQESGLGYDTEHRGEMQLKGKPSIHTYWLWGRSGFDSSTLPYVDRNEELPAGH